MKCVCLFQWNNINFKCNGTKEYEENHESIVIKTVCQVDI
jgi:hypothetical protein